MMGYFRRLVLWISCGLVMVGSPIFAKELTRKPNIAVIDFAGDHTVTLEQLAFISGVMASELIETNQFVVLDRGRMETILREQGFQQSGACNSNECQIQVGQLLGVDKLVAGNLVRFGPTYMLRLDYLDVATGTIEKSVRLQQNGELHEIVDAMCKEGAQKLQLALFAPATVEEVVQPNDPRESLASRQTVTAGAVPKQSKPRKPLSVKRKIALSILGTSALAGASGYWFDRQAVAYMDDYTVAVGAGQYGEALATHQNATDTEIRRNISYGASAGMGLAALVLWFWPEGK
jgi:hypothetical protein